MCVTFQFPKLTTFSLYQPLPPPNFPFRPITKLFPLPSNSPRPIFLSTQLTNFFLYHPPPNWDSAKLPLGQKAIRPNVIRPNGIRPNGIRPNGVRPIVWEPCPLSVCDLGYSMPDRFVLCVLRTGISAIHPPSSGTSKRNVVIHIVRMT